MLQCFLLVIFGLRGQLSINRRRDIFVLENLVVNQMSVIPMEYVHKMIHVFVMKGMLEGNVNFQFVLE
jgi:hypothetical protein